MVSALVVQAKSGDEKVVIKLVYRLNPAVKKYSRWSDQSVVFFSRGYYLASALFIVLPVFLPDYMGSGISEALKNFPQFKKIFIFCGWESI